MFQRDPLRTLSNPLGHYSPIFGKALAPHRGWYKQGCIEEDSRIAPFMALSRLPKRCPSASLGCLGCLLVLLSLDIMV